MGSSKILTVNVARVTLRAAGLRATAGRIAVLQTLDRRKSPTSHAEAYRILSEQGFDTSTVFRALNDMAEGGLLRRLELGDHTWRYERAAEESPGKREQAGHSPHPHFLCVDCGTITCLNEIDVEELQGHQPKASAIGQVTEVLLKGHCRECLEV